MPDRVVITGTGLFTPPFSISNEELVASLTVAVEEWNAERAAQIAEGTVAARPVPDAEFIERASGIKSRYVMEKSGVLDPQRLRPHLPTRSEDELGLQAEMALPAIHEALAQAGRRADEVDCVIVGCSNLQRAYPAVAIEIQHALGAGGWAYDMNVACSSATFSMQAGVDALLNGSADCVVVVHPEITSGHNNFAARDHHFIFGDACTAVVLERAEDAIAGEQWEVLRGRLLTKFSNSIRNDFGFLNPSEDTERDPAELVFRQRGQQVFKEVCPMVVGHINEQLQALSLEASQVRRFWLHQANLKMNQLIAKGVLGRVPDEDEAPVILDRYANTSSAGSVIAFHLCRDGMVAGDIGVICSFGAGYSIGSQVIRRL
ncbi:MAG: beta-ketoacyl-ACP synthase III [Acidimicrobiaceae bacterium]|nr:beta-ketoacyl-ACP synthase III [Acidimicrobiaceae bacterium]MBP7888192.1 beta-ketoacyl-ACP synthase III [Ilumatobacteraceae bacterium]MBP9051739.1 beta-ketoacyl-ACP synthase III [Ilumatobacteraceae bacterium]HAN34218.1 beta-ketoacyl-ACP synthase III [Acidimicrobiaceae bacterium]HQY84152.1 beta-ketoacyl-ACP synthase III [Ilumatobacteraceae bacterium]